MNQITAENVPELFARNERVVCLFDTERGPMAVVRVGAMIVASIETVWAGLVTPPKRELKTFRYDRSRPCADPPGKAPSSVASSWAPPPSSCSARSGSRSTTASGQQARAHGRMPGPAETVPDLAGTGRPASPSHLSPPPGPPGRIVSEGCGSISMLLEFGKVLSSLCRPLGRKAGLPHGSCPGHDGEPASRVRKRRRSRGDRSPAPLRGFNPRRAFSVAEPSNPMENQSPRTLVARPHSRRSRT